MDGWNIVIFGAFSLLQPLQSFLNVFICVVCDESTRCPLFWIVVKEFEAFQHRFDASTLLQIGKSISEVYVESRILKRAHRFAKYKFTERIKNLRVVLAIDT